MRGHLPAGLLTCVIALTALSGCSQPRVDEPADPAGSSAESSPSPAPTYSGPLPAGVPGFDYSDPDRVCHAFTVAMLSSDATTDASPLDAHGRASAFMTAPAPTTDPGLGDARWTDWVAHRAKIAVELTDYVGEELEPDQPALVSRAVIATTTPQGSDGWRGPAERETVYCTLERIGTAWRVSSYDADYFGPV